MITEPILRGTPFGPVATEAPAAPNPPRPKAASAGRRADIQGLRAVAVILVVLFHAGVLVRGGFVGVDVFFVISGFVITAMMVRTLERDGRLSLREFYSRRVRRLLPAVALMVVTVAFAAAFLLSPLGTQQVAAKTGAASSLFSSNGLLLRQAGYFDPSSQTDPLLHTWSLAVEEQFYLVFPAVLLLSWYVASRIFRRPPRLVASLVLLIGGSGSLMLCVWMTRDQQPFAFYSSPTRAWEFSVGALLALAAPRLMRMDRRSAGIVGATGLALTAAAAARISGVDAFPGVIALVPVLGTAGVIAAGTAAATATTRLLSFRPLVWLGDVSYGWYLWHWPAIVFAGLVWGGNRLVLLAAAFLALIPAWLSYRLVENPIRLSSRMHGRRLLALAVACVVTPVLACTGLWLMARRGYQTHAVARAATEKHADVLRGCDNPTPLPERPVGPCTWAVAGAKGTVVLIGDSNAGQFTEPVAKAANAQGFSLTVATKSSCPFVDVAVIFHERQYRSDGCQRFVADSLAGLSRMKPSLVIIASSATAYVEDHSIDFRSPSGEIARSADDKARLWSQGVAGIVGHLSSAGVPAVVVHTIPHFENFDVRTCPSLLLSQAEGHCAPSVSRSQVEEQQRRSRTAEDAAIQGVPLTTGADFTDDLCGADRCGTYADGIWLYHDGGHLTVAGALTLTGRFADLIGAHALPVRT